MRDIKKEILEVMEELNLDRMPSRKEIESSSKGSGLVTAIGRNGGFVFYAKLIGVKSKSQTKQIVKWTDEKVVSEIKEVMLALNLDRMPSRSEIRSVTNDDKLTNKLTKSGGFYYWAEKLGLEVKSSCTYESLQYEKKLVKTMLDNGFEAEITPVQFPYDALVGSGTKIDVKVSNGYRSEKAGFFFTFNLEYKMPKCDFYVFYCVHELCTKTLIVPAHVMTGKKQFSIGIKSKYDVYKDQWLLIFDHVRYMEELKDYVY